jgi:Transposase C of IS166 homeodomain
MLEEMTVCEELFHTPSGVALHESDSSIVMPIDALPEDLDTLRALVSSLSSERDAAIEECRRVREQNDRLHHLLRQLQRAQFGQRSERLDHEQMQLALEDIETTIAEQDAQKDDCVCAVSAMATPDALLNIPYPLTGVTYPTRTLEKVPRRRWTGDDFQLNC